MTLPVNEPTDAGLPDEAKLVSVQDALLKLKLVLAPSVSVTGLVMLVTEI